MEKIEIPYKGLRFRLDEFTYDPGSMGNYYSPPEPPEFIIDKMSVADDWKVNGTYEWHDVPQPLLGLFSDDDDFVELCFAAFREEAKEEKLERLIAEEEDE